MKKILILLVLLLGAKGGVYAQSDHLWYMNNNYGFNVDTVNSVSYLKKQGLFRQAKNCKTWFTDYKKKLEIMDSVSLIFLPFNVEMGSTGVSAIEISGGYKIYVTLERL